MLKRLRSMKKLASAAVFLMLATLVFPFTAPVALAQATTGTIRGVVSDQAGAVVPGATVSAKNQNTGVESPKFRATGDGIYNIPDLIPGVYTVTVEAQNFKKAVFTEVSVKVGQASTIDASLQPGGVTDVVTVTAGGEEVINKETSQLSSSFESRKVAELPSNVAGAGLDTLALLAPGVVPGFGNVNSNGITLSVNGQRARSNNFTIDGQDNNDLSIGGPNYFVDNQDAVAEFQIITNNFSAQYGRNQGAIVNIATKAGTNGFHGSAFEFHRDSKNFDSLNNLEKRSGQKHPNPLLYNVFGGTVGGPIKKDRAFFFGSFQGIETRQSFTARSGSLAILPSEFARLSSAFPGNPIIDNIAKFSAFALTDFGDVHPRTDLNGGQATGTTVVNGRTFLVGGPFDVIVLPIDPTKAATGTNAIGFQAANPERVFAAPQATPYSQKEGTGRVDWKINDKNSVWGRALYQTGNFKNGLGGSNGFVGDEPAKSQNYGATYTRQLSPRTVNEGRFAYSNLFVKFGGGCEGTLKGCITDPAKIGENFANLALGGVRGATTGAGLQTIGPATNLPQGRTVTAYQWSDNFSMTRGRHQMIVGLDQRKLTNSVPFLPNINGAFSSFSAARLVLNSPGLVTLAAGKDTLDYTEFDQFYFFQDDFKVRDNLTLNLGIRYEYIGQPINLLHRLTVARESDPSTALFKLSLPIEARTVPKLDADKNNWAPRVGFAWTPRFKEGLLHRLVGEDAMVIRGGYSIAYDPPFYNILLNISTNAPVVFNSTTQNPASPTASNPVLFPLPSGDAFGPNIRAFATARGLIVKGVLDPNFQNQVPVAPNFHLPYAQQWSLGIQRQINRNNVFEVRYVGTHATGLFETANRNPRIDRLLNGFTTTVSGFGSVVFPGFPNLLPSGLTPLVAGTAPCVDDPATPFVNEANQCNGRVLPRGRIQSRDNAAQSIYHGLQSRYNGRLFNQFTLGLSYTYSHAIDNSSEIFSNLQNTALAQNPFDLGRSERSNSGFDRRHAFAMNGIWDVPWFKDQKGIIGHILGGWQTNGTWVLTSGRRFTATQNFNGLLGSLTYTDPLIGDTLRPFFGSNTAPVDQVGITQVDAALLGFGNAPNPNINGILLFNDLNNGKFTSVTKDQVRFIFNGPGAARLFGTPFGNVPRFGEQGPTLNQVNLGIFKNFRIREKMQLQFRTEMFNAFNHPAAQYGLERFEGANDVPSIFIENAGIAGSAFHRKDDMQFGRRIMQFGLRFVF